MPVRKKHQFIDDFIPLSIYLTKIDIANGLVLIQKNIQSNNHISLPPALINQQ